MSLFRSAVSAAIPALESVFGEQFRIIPMMYHGGRTINDVDRDQKYVNGILTDLQSNNDLFGERNASGMSKGVASAAASGMATIDIKMSSIPYALRAKDRIQRVETGEIYEITSAPSGDIDHIFLRVTKIGEPI